VRAETCSIALEGPAAAPVMEQSGGIVLDRDYGHVLCNSAIVARVSLTGQPGYRLYAPTAARAEIVRRLTEAGAQPATAEDARLMRIGNGRPRYGEDIGETSLAPETGQMHAVSFNKGCYLGQEIVERVRAQGHVNRRLVRLHLDSAVPAGAALTVDGAEAGEITSAALDPAGGGAVALAYVRSAYAAPGQRLAAGQVQTVVTGIAGE